jgi:CheY-like chemotaxis protein
MMRALIVDDEPLARAALERVLRSRADVHSFDSAKDGYEALDLLQKNPYDVVLLDIRMPELSGIELADRLTNLRDSLPSIVSSRPTTSTPLRHSNGMPSIMS